MRYALLSGGAASLILSVLLRAAALPPPQNPARAEPSYAQTRDLVILKMNEAAGLERSVSNTASVRNHRERYEFRNVSMNRCLLQYTSDFREDYQEVLPDGVKPYSEHIVTTVSIPLSKIAKANTDKLPFGYSGTRVFFLIPTAAVHVFLIHEISGRLTERSETDSNAAPDLLFGRPGTDTADVARRMEGALNHAIEICKARLPQSKEPN